MSREIFVPALIEIVAHGVEGYIPLGIVNVEQALCLPAHPDLQFSYLGEDPTHSRVYMDHAQLHALATTNSSS